MQALKLKKNELIEEKKQMRAVMEEAKTTTDKLVKDKKDVKSNLKFSSIEEIEKEIAKLKRRQETTTMSLTDEKKLIKEMEALSASKKYVATLQAKDTAMEDVKEQRKTIQQQIAAKAKEIDAVTKELDQIMNVIKEQNEKDSVKRGSIQGLFQERDSFKGKVAQLIKEKDALRNAYREQNNAWYQNQRAVRAQKQMQYEEEKKRREEEMAAKQALIDAEEAKKVPYEEEQNLCDFLADYLDRTYLSTADNSEKVNTAIKDAPVAVTDDPFAGLQAVSKKDDDDAGYFGKGKGKKKRVRAPKKDGAAGGPFTLSVDSFEQFGLLQLTPPVSIDQVATSVAELRAKKEWYKEQPRGGVPTAAEIRKAKAASSQQSEAAAVAGAKPKAQKVFSLSKDEFAPLGATTTAAVPFSINAAWGQKSATPVEAAADAESAEK